MTDKPPTMQEMLAAMERESSGESQALIIFPEAPDEHQAMPKLLSRVVYETYDDGTIMTWFNGVLIRHCSVSDLQSEINHNRR